MASSRLLSSSVSWPSTCKRTRRPSDCERSRTMRGILEKIFETGCMRAFITDSRRSAVTISRRRLSRVILGSAEVACKNLVAGQHQLAHQIHHPVQQRHIDAQRAFGGASSHLESAGRAASLSASAARFGRSRLQLPPLGQQRAAGARYGGGAEAEGCAV